MKQTKIINILIGVKLLIALVAAWGYFTNPHIIRQVDTMGVSLMYAKKFAHSFNWFNFLPTALSAGDYINEVTPMEFPLLNLILSPFFLITWKYNFALAHMALILLNYSLFYFIYREMKGEQWKERKEAWKLIPLYGISLLYIDRYMPDATAFLLCSLSIVWIWSDRKLGWAIFVAMIALLIKPPVVITYAIFLFIPMKRWPKLALILSISVIPTIVYYTAGMEYLKSISHMAEYFSCHIRSPMMTLKNFFGHPKLLFNFLFKDNLYRYSVVFLIFGLIDLKRKKHQAEYQFVLKLLGVFSIQILIIGVLNGGHNFLHSYYSIGTSFVCCYMVYKAVAYNQKLLNIFILFLVFSNLERSYYRLRPLKKDNIRKEAQSLLVKVPELKGEERIRTEFHPVPRLGLAFGKISNSKAARFGVYSKEFICENVRAESQNYKVCEF